MVCDVSINSETLLIIDFVNLNIKSLQYFRDTHKMCVLCVDSHEYSYIYEYYVCTIFL
jgi:hypothetical protein